MVKKPEKKAIFAAEGIGWLAIIQMASSSAP